MDRLLGEHGALAALRARLQRRGSLRRCFSCASAHHQASASDASATAPRQPLRHALQPRRAGAAAPPSRPSSAPTAKPATWAMTSVPSPAEPVHPSRMTPAISGPQRRTQRCGRCKRSRQENADIAPSAANTAVEAPTERWSGGPSRPSRRLASAPALTVSSQAVPAAHLPGGEIAEPHSGEQIRRQVRPIQVQRERGPGAPPLSGLHARRIELADVKGIQAYERRARARRRPRAAPARSSDAADPGVRDTGAAAAAGAVAGGSRPRTAAGGARRRPRRRGSTCSRKSPSPRTTTPATPTAVSTSSRSSQSRLRGERNTVVSSAAHARLRAPLLRRVPAQVRALRKRAARRRRAARTAPPWSARSAVAFGR